MVTLSELQALGQPVSAHRPWPRTVLTAPTWRHVADRLAAGDLTLLGLWGEPATVHMAVLGAGERPAVAVFSIETGLR